MNQSYDQYALYHHGIKGQKWGIRRFQNDDGSLTAEGKRRYRTDDDINDKGETRKSVRDRLYKDSQKYDKMSKTYYDKSEEKELHDKYNSKSFDGAVRRAVFDGGRDQMVLDSTNEDGTKLYRKERTYSSSRGYEDYKEWKGYDRDKDTNYKRSETYDDKARQAKHDADALGQHYVAGRTFATTALGAIAGAAIGGYAAHLNGKSGRSFVNSMLKGAIGGAAVSGLAGNAYARSSRKEAEEKYGFKQPKKSDNSNVSRPSSNKTVKAGVKTDRNVSSTGNTLKNRAKSALGVYEDGDNNPYVSERRRQNRRREQEQYENGMERERSRNRAKHSQSGYDELFHGCLANTYGIRR